MTQAETLWRFPIGEQRLTRSIVEFYLNILITLSISATLTPMVQAMINATATCVYHDNRK